MNLHAAAVGPAWKHPTGKVPEVVHVVALGASCTSWMKHSLTKGLAMDERPTEVWTVNRGVRLFQADLAFVLDNLEAEARKDPAYGAILKSYKKPVITTVYSNLAPSCHVYPGAEILDSIERQCGRPMDPYWHNSIPMVVAYAWFIGVLELTLWGCDYTLPDGRIIENDRANLEYWIGFVRACGMRVGAPMDSTLLNNRQTGGQLHVYGLLDQTLAPAFVGL